MSSVAKPIEKAREWHGILTGQPDHFKLYQKRLIYCCTNEKQLILTHIIVSNYSEISTSFRCVLTAVFCIPYVICDNNLIDIK